MYKKLTYILLVLVTLAVVSGCGASSADGGNAAGNGDAGTQMENTGDSEPTDATGTSNNDDQTGQDASEYSLDCEALVNELLGIVEDEMTKLDEDLVETNYDLISKELYSDVCCYMSTGATANEIAVFTCVSEDAAKEVESGLSARVQSRIKSYQDYNPKEAKKLSKAIIAKRGNYALIVVVEDEKAAADILKKY